jgi:hypothetical protein
MEKLYYNLSEEEYTTGRKILLWVVTILFFLGGIYVAMLSPIFGRHSINPVTSLAPFGIGILIGITALMATVKRKDMFFLIDNDKIEFRYGFFRPKKHSFLWTDIKKLVMPHRERKVKLMFKNNTSTIINLSIIQRKRSILIRKHLILAAWEKHIDVLKVISLAHHKSHLHSHAS